MLVMQAGKHQFQIGRVLDSMNRHTQYLAIDPQLLKGPDTVAVGGDQRQFFRPETHDAARCQFGRGGGFAHPGRTHQCIDAALIHQGVFILQHGHLPCHGRFDVLQAAGMVLAGGQIFQQVFGQARTESGPQQGTQQLPAQRIAPLRFIPHEAGELLFNHAPHGMNFTQNAVAAAIGIGDGSGLKRGARFRKRKRVDRQLVRKGQLHGWDRQARYGLVQRGYHLHAFGSHRA